jgi:hypothetical protein
VPLTLGSEAAAWLKSATMIGATRRPLVDRYRDEGVRPINDCEAALGLIERGTQSSMSPGGSTDAAAPVTSIAVSRP